MLLATSLLGALIAPVAVPLSLVVVWGLVCPEGLVDFLENQGMDSICDHIFQQQHVLTPVMILGVLPHASYRDFVGQ